MLKEGFYFVIGTDWNPVEGSESFGALPYIIGTLVNSAIAMVIAVPISIGIAIFVNEMVKGKIGTVLSFVVELLAAVYLALFMVFGRYLYFDL